MALNDCKVGPSEDEEFQAYLRAIISARNASPLKSANLKRFLDNHFEASNTRSVDSMTTHSQDSSGYTKNISEAVEFFVEFCILIFAKALRSHSQAKHDNQGGIIWQTNGRKKTPFINHSSLINVDR